MAYEKVERVKIYLEYEDWSQDLERELNEGFKKMNIPLSANLSLDSEGGVTMIFTKETK